MTAQSAEQRARELLAAEYKAAGRVYLGDAIAIRAIVAALAALPHMQPAGEAVALTLGQRAVARELLACCESWEPNVCVMGNVRAKDAADLLRFVLATPPQPSAEPRQEAQGAVATVCFDNSLAIVKSGIELEPGTELFTALGAIRLTTPPAPVDVRLRKSTLRQAIHAMRRCQQESKSNWQVYIDDAERYLALLSAQPSADAAIAAIAAQREAGEG